MYNTETIVKIRDEFHVANAILEVCRGYTQAEVPDLKSLDAVLFKLVLMYERIYKELSESNW